MGDLVIFQMWAGSRQEYIAKHEFYVEQARKRLLAQFEDISGEADKFAEEWLSKAGRLFDPELYDTASFYERAHDKSINFYEMLNDMHNQTRLSVIAGMYHQWDKQLRDWLSTELRSVNQAFGDGELKAAIWRENISQIFTLLECCDWKVRAQPYYVQLDICSLVVNVYKHGIGNSFDELKKNHREFLKEIFSDTLSTDARDRYLDHTHLRVTDEHLSLFSDAIIAFWSDVPEEILQSTIIAHPPIWFKRAWDYDIKD